MDNGLTMLITKSEYDDLKVQAMKYSQLLQIMIDEAKLNTSTWDGNECPLLLDNKKINMILSINEKSDFERKVKELKEKEKKNNE